MWFPEVSKYFFEADENNNTSDERFLERYCSIRMRRRIKSNNVNVGDLRKIIHILTKIVPDLDHTTPGWSHLNGGLLLSSMGRAHLQWREGRATAVIKKSRFGLCADRETGQIHFWTDSEYGHKAEKDHPPYTSSNPEQWSAWLGDDTKSIFKEPLQAKPLAKNASDPLFEGGVLWHFLEEKMSDAKSSNFITKQAFCFIRDRLGIPEECDVIVPRLTDGVESINVTVPATTSEVQVSRGTAKTCNERDERAQGQAHTLLDEAASEVLASFNVQANRNESLMAVPDVVGQFYVYALKDPNSQQPFYIGKGAYDRVNQHFRFRPIVQADGVLNAEDLTDSFGEPGNAGDSSIGVSPVEIFASELEGNAETQKHQKIRELTEHGVPQEDIARVLARGLSSGAALAVEALLIKGVYGMSDLTNVVSGHHDYRFRAAGDWDYKPGFDLPCAPDGSFRPDDQGHRCGSYYVYVLRDPVGGRIFYVGKGKAGRLCQHFTDAINSTVLDPFPRLMQVKSLLDQGHAPFAIGRVIARVDSEALAFVIESFYMKFVTEFSQLHNVQPGHLFGMFRTKNDWQARHGFDLPTNIQGGMRLMLRDMFLGEGLDKDLAEVVYSAELSGLLANHKGPKLLGAGELAYLCQIQGVPVSVVLRVQIRCARRIQIGLHPIGQSGKDWISENFSRFGLGMPRRHDHLFIPVAWRGAANVAVDTAEAIRRSLRMAKLAQVLEKSNCQENLGEFQDLLLGL
jgi:hypothetical protein